MPAIILISLLRQYRQTQRYNAFLSLGVFAVSRSSHLWLFQLASSWFHPFLCFSPRNTSTYQWKKAGISITSNHCWIHFLPASLADTSSQIRLSFQLFSHLRGLTEVQFPHVKCFSVTWRGRGESEPCGVPSLPRNTREGPGHCRERDSVGPLPAQPGPLKHNMKRSLCMCTHVGLSIWLFKSKS